MSFSKFSDLYIHIPFCRGKCDYCAFYSEPSASQLQTELWLERIRRNLEDSEFRLQELESLYLGGGTPTVLSAKDLLRLFDLLRSHLAFSPRAEISIECNPGTLDAEKAQAIATFANRVSVGVQSFDEDLLATLGRRNALSFSGVERVFDDLRGAGVANVGLDLIYAIPGQTLESWRRDLELALRLKPSHISAYSLTIEEGTRLAQGSSTQPDDELSAAMWELAGKILGDAGLPRYEVSNYASKDFECRHNQGVWHGRRYLGLGPSASSFDGARRWTEARSLDAWLSGADPEFDDLPPRPRARELFAMGLRTVRGWSSEEFKTASGLPWTPLEPKLKGLSEDGLLTFDEKRVKPTEKGLAFWNSIAEEIL